MLLKHSQDIKAFHHALSCHAIGGGRVKSMGISCMFVDSGEDQAQLSTMICNIFKECTNLSRLEMSFCHSNRNSSQTAMDDISRVWDAIPKSLRCIRVADANSIPFVLQNDFVGLCDFFQNHPLLKKWKLNDMKTCDRGWIIQALIWNIKHLSIACQDMDPVFLPFRFPRMKKLFLNMRNTESILQCEYPRLKHIHFAFNPKKEVLQHLLFSSPKLKRVEYRLDRPENTGNAWDIKPRTCSLAHVIVHLSPSWLMEEEWWAVFDSSGATISCENETPLALLCKVAAMTRNLEIRESALQAMFQGLLERNSFPNLRVFTVHYTTPPQATKAHEDTLKATLARAMCFIVKAGIHLEILLSMSPLQSYPSKRLD